MAQQGSSPPPGAGTPAPGPLWARLWARRHRLADWLLAAAFFPWTGLMIVGDPHGVLGWVGAVAAVLTGLEWGALTSFLGVLAAAAVAAGASVVVLLRRSRPRLLLWAAAAALLLYGDFGLPALALFTYAAWYTDRRRLVLWTAGLSVAFIGVYAAGDTMTRAQATSVLVMTYGMPLAVGLWIGTRRALVANLRERAERLEREQHLLADQAITAERTRIAREMHDVVAHRVSLMVLHAGGLEVSAPDERTAQSAALIRSTGRDALAELRGILGVLRDEAGAAAPTAPQPVLADLTRLLDEWRAAGTVVSGAVEGAAGPLPAHVERTAYRTVQEALTNAAKHAPGAPVRVHLRHRPDTLEITVDNAPPPAAPAQAPPSGGYGLAGLRERLALAGGELRAGPLPDGGWRLGAVLPTAGYDRGGRREAAR
ncbi:sensor histidine kinase [Streptomonospora sp. PA3]|uniref:sensor histidine kinase n=1 Tax=Streptomonospora sp. PA3 TaxID=2607326 RepID=UPI0012DF715C|nr:histidine kinase [Streptomonospora sp. PA3]MUL43415.1 sensor histidine kinase [Streptomonospora sp. PA3]